MKTLTSAILAGGLALALAGAAQAQTIPNPTNPTPAYPVATDGSPLPYHGAFSGNLLSGRSAYAPASTPFNALVGGGLGVADTAGGTGLGTAGAVVDGTAASLGAR